MFKMSKFKFAVLSIVMGASAFQIGCSDAQVAGSIAGAFIVAAVADSQRPVVVYEQRPTYRPRRSGQASCHLQTQQYCDQWGRCSAPQVTEHSCYRNNSFSPEATGPQKIVIDNSAIAAKYSLSTSSAEKLISSMIAAQNANSDAAAVAAFANIGLDLKSIKAMGKDAKITQDMIDGMSTALSQNPVDTQNMLESILNTVRDQEAAKNASETVSI